MVQPQPSSLHHQLPLSSMVKKLPLSLSTSAVGNETTTTPRKFVDSLTAGQHNKKTFSTPESSQTDSDDVSPQIQRKRKTLHARDILPRFSISIDDEHSVRYVCSKSSEVNNLYCFLFFFFQHRPDAYTSSSETPISGGNSSGTESGGMPPNIQTKQQPRSRSVVKSASALGLSLMAGKCVCSYVPGRFYKN